MERFDRMFENYIKKLNDSVLNILKENRISKIY